MTLESELAENLCKKIANISGTTFENADTFLNQYQRFMEDIDSVYNTIEQVNDNIQEMEKAIVLLKDYKQFLEEKFPKPVPATYK
jgi:uncharacterized protein YoxC